FPGPEPVPFREHADGLLYAHPRGQGVLKLRYGDCQPRRLINFFSVIPAGSVSNGSVPSGSVSDRGGRLRIRGLAPGVVAGRMVGGDQVRERHGTGQVGDVLVADHPAVIYLADDHLVWTAVWTT